MRQLLVIYFMLLSTVSLAAQYNGRASLALYVSDEKFSREVDGMKDNDFVTPDRG